MIAFGFWAKESTQGLGLGLIITGLFLFMANFGLTLGPVVWVYLPEIVQSSIIPYATATNWGSASLITLLFPVIKDHLPKKNPAWLFIFFALWCGLSFIFNKKYLVETRNKTEKEICLEYRKVRIGC
jgi:SP family arabinose:H+ symporter-like MFS transporter